MYKFKGAWDENTIYSVGDVVNHNGETWWLAEASSAEPGAFSRYWFPVDQDAGELYRSLPNYQTKEEAFSPTITSLAGGDTLQYDATAQKWKNAKPFAPTVTSPQDGDVLVYDGTAQKWKNAAPSGGGGVTVVHFTTDGEGIKTLDTKAGVLYAACQQAPVFISGYNTDMQIYKCELIEDYAYDESEGYNFNGEYTAQTADDYPASSPDA